MQRVLLFLLFAPFLCKSQTIISGYVKNNKGTPIPYVNIYLKDILDGGSTNDEGYYSFTTTATGKAILIVSSIGYRAFQKEIDLINGNLKINISLKPGGNNLPEIVLSAGAFEASDKKKGTILKPLDIVTNPGASGDIYGALATLPGVTPVGNETGLFVRGGEASETKTIIDGSLVQSPFFSQLPDLPSRGRFNPFLFSGTLFSTGGYSAQYGQALSSVLLLETNDFPSNDNYSFGMNLAGINASFTKTWKKNTALLFSMGYSNLSTLFSLVPQNRTWGKPPEGVSSSIGLRHYTGKKKGLFKSFLQYRDGSIGLSFPSPENPTSESSFANNNKNLFWNNSFEGKLSSDWRLFISASLSYDEDLNQFNNDAFSDKDWLTQSRITINRKFGRNRIRLGSEIQFHKQELGFNQNNSELQDTFQAFYAESDLKLSDNLALRVGVRGEKSSIIDKSNIAPRLSFSSKAGGNSIVSLAYGKFHQTPNNDFLRNMNTGLNFESATHYIANYQWKTQERLFRIEAYYKDYESLIIEGVNQNLSNEGFGFSKGIDVFWRDQKLIKNLTYWISYSLIDSKRLYRDFSSIATPTFVSKHNLNLVANYRITPLIRIGMSYTYASGRPYFNPNNSDFLSDRTIDFHNMNFSSSYLTSLFGNFTVIYVSLRNPFTFNQVFGYRYSEDGTRRNPITPASNWSFFAGVSISIQK